MAERYSPDVMESAQDWFNRTEGRNDNSIIDTMSKIEPSESPSLSKSDKQDIARGAIQGGKSALSGALIGGGTSAILAGAGPAGWAALVGGALLSESESQSQAEAMQEQENINAEIKRRQNAQSAGNSLLAVFNSFGNRKI